MFRSLLIGPSGLAVLVTLANAVKPVLIDDTAYLTYARHIAQHPLDPYGFDIYWYSGYDSALTVLCPPVVPYWLALGIRLFGEHVFLLKLWLFPFVWLLAWSLAGLLRRFARGTERLALPLIMLSPTVLPGVNLMLDIPALALGFAALRVFTIAADRHSWWLAAASGVLAALAMQTKYTMLLVPVVLAWYGLTHRSIRLSLLSLAVAAAGFAGWEAAVSLKYGQSHFLYHLHESNAGRPGTLTDYLDQKAELVAPLVAHLGCLAVGFGLFAGRAIGFPRWVVLAAAVLWVAGAITIAVLPYHSAVLIRGKEPWQEKLTIPATVWRSAGTADLITAAGCAAVLLVRWSKSPGLRKNPDSLFLVGWVLLELGGYFPLTPFPAARRVFGVSLALGLLAARAVSRVSRARPDRRVPRWVVPFGIAAGVLVAALDTFDAFPEKVLAERAAEVVADRPPDSTVWFAGHWGFQHYCERAGMKPAIAGQTLVAPGDYLAWPVFPDADRFHRPDSSHTPPPPPPWVAEPVVEFVWDDWLSARTIPNFYGGVEPVVGRDHPRLRVVVYRMTRPWLVGDMEPPPWMIGGGPHQRPLDILRGREP